MSQVILHHYPLSPYSEKIRLALGLKGVSWNSVEIPVWTPRPKLTPMSDSNSSNGRRVLLRHAAHS
jgi:glutathione S-transferase